ncbi:MAG: hypothetical protein A2790_12085 [Phenylobacterium sp. RIFCSPHIGHO2_01_FULL_69_31]|uniref:hypothetical protein n=1 Tax=Phenylobacterium sp. RIFCSPHIGHO2_01_FULL_69_31 TaxID=1801944 RepID=UPI0008C6284D|nr:hypothetical protein [Phenylobacterium sp. RIFCSPHIGHO2_01_FULL_69_31]OHB28150.1 MAG: hypothetical protein A2790_12085 [Phenylobacterium sp. RIFCSPHIGHO2_01_FULL_69_31]
MKTMITNVKPEEDPKVKEMLANLTNAVKEAVKAGIEAAFDDGEDDGRQEQANNVNPMFGGRQQQQPKGLAAFKLPKAEG